MQNEVLFYQKEQEDKKKELQNKKYIYRTLSRVKAKRNNIEQRTMEQETSMYEEKRKGHRKTTLDKIVDSKLQKAKSLQD